MISAIWCECKGGYHRKTTWLLSSNGEFQKPYVDYSGSSSSGKSGVICYFFINDGVYTLKTTKRRYRVSVSSIEGASYERIY